MNSQELQKLLIKKRKTLGYSHQDVVDIIGITRQYYSMIEKGERTPSVEVAKKISGVLGLNWTVFFS